MASGVIVATLLPALFLPAVVRWARLTADTSVEEELRYTQTTAVRDALAALPEVAADLGTDRASPRGSPPTTPTT